MTLPRPPRATSSAPKRPTLKVPVRAPAPVPAPLAHKTPDKPVARASDPAPRPAPAKASRPVSAKAPNQARLATARPAAVPAPHRPPKPSTRPGPGKVGFQQKPRPTPAAPVQEGVRLSKLVAAQVNCSRREAEQIIEGGWVRVNGQLVEEPMARVTDQTVVVDPEANPMALTEVTLLLHKPPGFEAMAPLGAANKRLKPAQALLQAATHWAQDESTERVLKRHLAKLSAAVPLELAASGLVVFTQDWRVLRKLTEDAAHIEHELAVEVQGEVSPEQLHRLNVPAVSAGSALPPVKVSVNSTGEGSTRLRFAVKGAHPGLAAYLCERAGLQILSLKRLRIGRVTLAHLPEGQWRYLLPHERF